MINLANYFYKKFYNNYRKRLYDNFKNDGSEEFKREAFAENLLLKTIKEVLRLLDGDYAFAIYDREYNNLAICRDPIGVKPLYYGMNDEINLKAFASEKKALWKAGIDDRNIYDLKPGSILYNWETIDLDDDLINKIIQTDFKEMKKKYSNYNDYLKTKDSYENYMELLENDLYSAVNKRVENIRDVGLIFSGGVDSTILAIILKKISEYRANKIENGESILPLNIKLYSVGVENSQDIEFSRKIADELGLDLRTIIINRKIVRDSIKPVLTAIEDDNIMKLGVGMTIYLASIVNLKTFNMQENLWWTVFLWCVPMSFFIMSYFTGRWFKNPKYGIGFLSAFVWTILLASFITFLYKGLYWYLFFIGVPIQIALILIYYLRKGS